MTTNHLPATAISFHVTTTDPDLARRIGCAIANVADPRDVESGPELDAEDLEVPAVTRRTAADRAAAYRERKRNVRRYTFDNSPAYGRLAEEHERLSALVAESRERHARSVLELDAANAEIAELRNVSSMIDGDRAHLRTDLATAEAEIKRLRAIGDAASPLCAAAQKWDGPWRAMDLSLPVPSPVVSLSCELMAACETYERAMSAIADAVESADDLAF